jgi:long-chain acyl-CoA synthetase
VASDAGRRDSVASTEVNLNHDPTSFERTESIGRIGLNRPGSRDAEISSGRIRSPVLASTIRWSPGWAAPTLDGALGQSARMTGAGEQIRPDALTGLVQAKPVQTLPHRWRDVASALEPSLAATPDAEALVGRYGRYTYRQLDIEVAAAAVFLWSLGVRPGDRVAACVANHCEIVIAFLAVQRLGAIWVGVNKPLAPPEKAFQLKDSGAAIVLADRAATAQIEPFRHELSDLRHLVDMEPGDPNSEWSAALAARWFDPAVAVAIDAYAPAAIAYTSGTTGHPKGAVHSQHNMMLVAASGHLGLRGDLWRPTQRRGVSLALTILNMMILDVVSPLSGGGACICIDRSDAAGVSEWVASEAVETFWAAPTTVFDFLEKPDLHRANLAGIEFVACGGSTVSDELRRLFEHQFHKPLLGAYGLTEAPTAVAATGVGAVATPEGSCGRIFEYLRCAILDDQDRELPVGQEGEVAIRAAETGPWAGLYAPMLGYWRRGEATGQALRNGWLHTGDIGSLDGDGALFIKDRLKELIIRGGANVYPAEIEKVLVGDPRVRDAAVVGRPDERLGETVCAFIELAPNAGADDGLLEDLKASCLGRLARYKIPETWIVVTRLPRNAMNKVAKAALRAELAHRDGDL